MEKLAKIAFDAYNQSPGTPNESRPFEKLDQLTKDAWVAVVETLQKEMYSASKPKPKTK